LIITIDTLRADRVGLYDNKHVKTPNIDRVGKDGSVFKYAFANVPVTLPSHTGIMSGLYPPTHNVRDNSGYIVNDKILTLAKYLKKYNYVTAAFIGAFPLDSRFGLNKGFDLYDDNYGSKNSNELFFVERKASKVIGLSLKWLKKRKNKWFAWIHIFDPHQPYAPPEPYKTEYKNDLYSGEVAYVDSQLKKLFDYLRKNGIYKKTMIIITADHGEGLGEHGEKTHAYFAYNTTIHIPLIIKLPDKNNHKMIDEFVSHIDIFPTVCETLKIKIPKQVEGLSLLPLIKGEKKKLKERWIYFESLPPYLNRGWAPLTGYIDTKTKIKYISQPIPEIYDLKNDFNEDKNIAGKLNIGKYKNRLSLLVKSFKKDLVSENKKIKSSDIKKLQSLGYLSSTVKYKKSKFTKGDDLKTLLPLQNEMLEGLALYAKGELNKSLVILVDVVKKRKDFVLVWNKIANIFRETGKINLAMVTYEKALEYNKNNYNLLLNYGAFLSKYGISDKAIEVLRKASKIIDYDPELWDNLGLSYWKNSDIDKAIDCFNKALELDNNNAIVYSNLGAMYLSFLLYDKAEENIKKALKIDPNLVDALNSYAALKKKKGDIKSAIQYWEKILNINPKFFMAYYNLISVYLDNGQYKKALEIYNKAKNRGILNVLDPNQKRDFNKLYNDLEVYLNEN
jgi:pentatricopeptide repeat protein